MDSINFFLPLFGSTFILRWMKDDFDVYKILTDVKSIYSSHFDGEISSQVETVLNDVSRLFRGDMEGYYPCDTPYHDLDHTMSSVLAMLRIMDSCIKHGEGYGINKENFVKGIVAAGLHDTGYIRMHGDDTGTGAKHAFEHVGRSVDFTSIYLPKVGFNPQQIEAIDQMIWCTHTSTSAEGIKFENEAEQLVGFCLGTADLCSQMAVPAYLEKLSDLYREFEEAYVFDGIENLRGKGHRVFDSLEEMISESPAFYEKWVIARFQKMRNVYELLGYYFADGKNQYKESIELNISDIKAYIASS